MPSTKTFLITSATSGIGKAAALALASYGGTLLLVSRKKERGEQIVREISEISGNENLELHIADVSSQTEVRRLVAEIRSKHQSIDVLVNNAAKAYPQSKPADILFTFELSRIL